MTPEEKNTLTRRIVELTDTVERQKAIIQVQHKSLVDQARCLQFAQAEIKMLNIVSAS